MTPHAPIRTVIYDGDCGFCKFWVARWRANTGDTFTWRSSQEAAADFPQISAAEFASALQMVEPDGTVFSGADAIQRIFAAGRGGYRFLGEILQVSAVLAITRWIYRTVATHRMTFSRGTRWFFGSDPLPTTYLNARRIFSAALGLVLVAAFASLGVQVRGLFGEHGIVPAAQWVQAVHEQLGSEVYLRAPSVFWLGTSDTALVAGCVVGVLAGVAMIFGICPGGAALLGWALYLSFCSIGSPFLNFQWDTLLLEAALIAAVYLPWKPRPRWGEISMASRIGRLLVCWLLFRLMFEAGVVKLASGDPNWRNLTALSYHFETQPLPIWTAWYGQQSPALVHKAGVLFTFAVELLAPLGILGPRRVRHACGWAMIALQVAILVTGNFAFFNWLSIALCIPIFDDTSWTRRIGRLSAGTASSHERWHWRAIPAIGLAILSLLITGSQLIGMLTGSNAFALTSLEGALASTRSFNSYGLFAVMTTERPEIIIEGSNDGQNWSAYEFRYKPGALDKRPGLVAPHQPRLDWQMWFAALGSIRQNGWLVNFMVRLLQGSPEVLDLMANNPFPQAPPKYVRALQYQYHFSGKNGGPDWWTRELQGEYCPAISLEDLATGSR